MSDLSVSFDAGECDIFHLKLPNRIRQLFGFVVYANRLLFSHFLVFCESKLPEVHGLIPTATNESRVII